MKVIIQTKLNVLHFKEVLNMLTYNHDSEDAEDYQTSPLDYRVGNAKTFLNDMLSATFLSDTGISILTKDELKEITPGMIFAEGTGTFPELRIDLPLRWVAVRGEGYHDWAIYYHTIDHEPDWVKHNGDKAMGENIIRRLVNCTDEVWELYRR